MFQTIYQPLSNEYDWGQVALLPWDAEIFGFPVGDYRMGDAQSIAAHLDEFRAAFNEWSQANHVELMLCTILINDFERRTVLPRLDFEFIDSTLQATQSRLQGTKLPDTRIKVRHATPEDQARVEEIAEHSFRFGRYTADLHFPRELANKRNRIWLRNAFKNLGPTNRVYVIESHNVVNGFLQVYVNAQQGNFAIFAVDPAARGARLTMDLCAGCLHEMQKEGLRELTCKVSAANLDIANFLIYFGFRFSQPQAVYHWYALHAPHLVAWEKLFAANK